MTQVKEIPSIDASPTKESFIAVLIRDVDEIKAISELVDNCVDGAKRTRPNGNFDGLKIDITYDDKSFVIEDNCGGISVDIAEHYAFRFGRPKKLPKELQTSLPVGQFGVGMKRALFRMGKVFRIESVAPHSSFVVEENIDKWKTQTVLDKDHHDVWEFQFKEYTPNQINPIEKCGTKITISPLNEGVSDELKLKNTQIKILESIQSENALHLRKGLKITVNGIELYGESLTLLKSNKIRPFHKTMDIPRKVTDEDGKVVTKRVKVRIYAGISDVSYRDSGWYVFCNGRLVLKANKDKATGWGDTIFTDPEDETTKVKIPKGHPQFSRFRGYAYFESNDASLLPWNTTKSGVDLGSPVYQAAKLEMIMATRQIIDFLNRLDNEIDNEDDFLSNQISRTTAATLSTLSPSAKFSYQRPTQPVSKTERIAYRKPVDEIERAKALLEITDTNDVGSKTFNFYLEVMEGDNG